jgi:hypothetical protein
MSSIVKTPWFSLFFVAALTGCNAAEIDAESDEGEEIVEAEDALAAIQHLGSMGSHGTGGMVSVTRPPTSKPGDLLVLFVGRSNGYVPLHLGGWTKVTECLKSGPNTPQCITEAHCTKWLDAAHCETFGDKGPGRDLAQVAYYRYVTSGEPSGYAWSFQGNAPAWVTLTALRGAAFSSPVRAAAGRSQDFSVRSVFPSVGAMAGDMVLLSQSFDDDTQENAFLPPPGTSLFEHVVSAGPSVSDGQTGYVFGGLVKSTGPTGQRPTGGPGGPMNKDLMITLAIKPAL